MLQRILLVTVLMLSIGCEQQPEDVIEDYFAAENWQERYAVVLQRATTRSQMKSHYGFSPLKDKVWNIVRIDGEKEVDVGKYIRLVVWHGSTQDRQMSHLYYVKRTPDGYRIDWEASLQDNPMSWKAYMAQRPLKPMIFRVAANLASYYNYEFSNAQPGYFSIKLDPYAFLYGYVKRGSKSGKRMYEILKDGETHHLTVKIRYLSDRSDDGTVLIDTLISESWIID